MTYTHKVLLSANCSSVVKGMAENLKARGIEFVSNELEADVVICSNSSDVKSTDERLDKRKPIIFWTNEPRWSNETEQFNSLEGRPLITMNCYTEDVYVDQFHYLWVGNYSVISPLTIEELENRNNLIDSLCCCIASQHGDGKQFVINNLDIDLYRERRELAVKMNSCGLCDIYGKGWPEGIAKTISSEGRDGKSWNDWESQKLNFLSTYKFNLAFENTNIKNYITEKLWHPIMAKVLPIYYSGNTGINDILPENSFIDYCQFSSENEMFDLMLNMPDSEYLARVNTLIESYNNLMLNPLFLKKSRENMSNKLASIILSYS